MTRKGDSISSHGGQITIRPVIREESNEIVSYDILFPEVDENNTNLTIKELDFLEEIRDRLKKFERNIGGGRLGRDKRNFKISSCKGENKEISR